ncbi:chemotaxis protein CheB [Paraburkholderia sp. 2C]
METSRPARTGNPDRAHPGANADGSAGLRAIKVEGGIVMAQDPETAGHAQCQGRLSPQDWSTMCCLSSGGGRSAVDSEFRAAR